MENKNEKMKKHEKMEKLIFSATDLPSCAMDHEIKHLRSVILRLAPGDLRVHDGSAEHAYLFRTNRRLEVDMTARYIAFPTMFILSMERDVAADFPITAHGFRDGGAVPLGGVGVTRRSWKCRTP